MFESISKCELTRGRAPSVIATGPCVLFLAFSGCRINREPAPITFSSPFPNANARARVLLVRSPQDHERFCIAFLVLEPIVHLSPLQFESISKCERTRACVLVVRSPQDHVRRV